MNSAQSLLNSRRLCAVILLATVVLWPADVFAAAPAGAWVTGPMTAVSPGAFPHCTTKNSYKANKALVFARDARGENSIAVDIGQKGLVAGSQYHVLLEVGFIDRKIIAVAATPQVLLLKTGKDDTLYGELAARDVMQLTFAHLSYTFGLAGVKAALAALDACVKTLPQTEIPVTAPAHTVVTAPETPGQMALVDSVRAENERLRAENRKLMLENQMVVAKMLSQQEPVAATPPQKHKAKPLSAPSPKTADEKFVAAVAAEFEQTRSVPLRKPAVKQAVVKVTHPAPKKTSVAPASRAPAPFLPEVMRRLAVAAQAENGGYSWTDGAVQAASWETDIAASDTVTQLANTYAAGAQTRCAGAFAFRHDDAYPAGFVTGTGAIQAVKAEMACLDGTADTAAALLFLTAGDRMAVLVLETPAGSIEQALDLRDRYAGLIGQY